MSLAKWDFDHAHSSVDFTVRHLLVSKVRGRFTKWTGHLELDEQDLTRSRVDIEIDVASVDTHEPQRDAHLRSGDFFEADKHPRIVFKSKRVEEKGKDHLAITGDLTIRGATREVVLDVERQGPVGQAARRVHRDGEDQPEGLRSELQPGPRSGGPRTRRGRRHHDRDRGDRRGERSARRRQSAGMRGGPTALTVSVAASTIGRSPLRRSPDALRAGPGSSSSPASPPASRPTRT
jgi:polyisoprenoid-binding protein YceI